VNEQGPADRYGFERLAEEILSALRECSDAGEIVLGGYFALRQYADYRTTRDLDAWWTTGRTERAVACIRRVMERVAARHGFTFAEREWGETVSFEFVQDRRTLFSFQIAVRAVELEPPRPSAWPPILVEGLADNVGSKMNALVQRGAARDFLDIRELVLRDVVSVEQCWDWWARKNPGVSVEQGRAQALRNLEALELRRPIDTIVDAEEQAAARAARAWIRSNLLRIAAQAADDS
jgi:hypothetical protein